MVGGEQPAIGFRLAGIPSYAITDDTADAVYQELKGRKAILIMTQKAARILGERAGKLKSTSMVVTIPEQPDEQYTSVSEIIKNTIGFELKKY